jgi:uncharacterized phage-associated protein
MACLSHALENTGKFIILSAMAYSANRVANLILEKFQSGTVDPMKLLKLTYLAQGWTLGLLGRPLISDDVEAWKYGPVFRQTYKQVAGKPVVAGPLAAYDSAALPAAGEAHMINEIHRVYGGMSGLALSAMTHKPGSPWEVTYRTRGQNSVIPHDLIQSHYAELGRLGKIA